MTKPRNGLSLSDQEKIDEATRLRLRGLRAQLGLLPTHLPKEGSMAANINFAGIPDKPDPSIFADIGKLDPKGMDATPTQFPFAIGSKTAEAHMNTYMKRYQPGQR